MNQKLKQVISIILATFLCLSFLPLPTSVLSSEAASTGLSLSQLRQKFPNGKYWNHAGNPGSSNSVNNQDGYTSTPCSKHGVVGTSEQTCNGFQPAGTQLSWQCMGYAEKLGYDATGYNPRNNANGWYTYTSSSALDNLKPGDIVRYKNNNHSIYVIGVSGDTVTYTDCNSDGHCVIRWDVTISKSTLKSSFTHVRSAPFAIDNSCSCSDSYAGTYTTKNVSSNLTIRSGHGTGYSVLGSIPANATFTVTKANGSWAHITYNGVEGYVSCDYIEKTGVLEVTGYNNTWTNTGNQRIDIVRVAETQLGYTEGTNNNTKYGAWYGLNYNPWCAMFVSWCARQANISTTILRNSAAAGCGPEYFNLSYYDGATYTPQIGDLFFTKTWSHVGIVRSVEGNYFYTVEGNSNTTGAAEGTSVVSNKRLISDYYFGVPAYLDANTKPADVANLTCSKKIYSTTESINFTWSSVENATNYCVYIWRDGVELFGYDCGYSTTYTQAPIGVGNYTLIVKAGNSVGYSEGISCAFTVTDNAPQEAWIWSDKSNIPVGTTVNFNYNAINAEWYVLGIYKDGICYQIIDTGKSDWGSYTFTEPGYYSVYATIYNAVSYTDTPQITVSVYDSTPTYTTIYSDKSFYDISETITINVETMYSNNACVGISKTSGERIITETATFPYKIQANRLGVGDYTAYFTLSNDYGGIDTTIIQFRIIDSQDYVNLGDIFYAYIENQSSGMYISNQQNNIVGEKSNNEVNQIWKFTRINSGAYVIESALDNSCIDVLGYSDELGTNIYSNSEGYKEQTNQQFLVYYQDNAFYFSPVFTEGKNMIDMDLLTYNVTLHNIGIDHDSQKFNIIKTSPLPKNVWVSIPNGPESSYKVNQEFSISFGGDIVVNFYVDIWRIVDGVTSYYFGTSVTNTNRGNNFYNISFDKTGHYSCIITASNYAGVNCSEWIGWDIVDSVPSNLIISTDKQKYNLNETINFKIDAIYGNNKQLSIYRNDNTSALYEKSDVIGDNYSCTINVPGHYKANFSATNILGTTESTWIYFDVGVYTVHFDANQGICNQNSKEVVNIAAYGELPIPSRTGYDFDGWYTSADGGFKIDSLSIVNLQNDTTLYAHWTHIHIWDEGTVTKIPTCNSDGETKYVCTVCNTTKTETISKDTSNHSGKTTVIKNQKNASCSTEGYTGDIYWSCCDVLYSKGNTVAKTEHTDANQDGKCDTCGHIMTMVDSKIIVTSVKVHPGTNITVPITIENNCGFSYMKITVGYDSSVFTFNGADNGNLSTDAFTVSGNNIAWDSAADASGNGILVNLNFTVSENANDGEYPVTVKLSECYNNLEEDALFTVVPGTVTVSSIIYGDVNGDGAVNGKDVIRLRKYLVDYDEVTDSSTVEITFGADCNGDGIINGKDLIRLRKYLVDYDEETGTSSVVLGK